MEQETTSIKYKAGKAFYDFFYSQLYSVTNKTEKQRIKAYVYSFTTFIIVGIIDIVIKYIYDSGIRNFNNDIREFSLLLIGTIVFINLFLFLIPMYSFRDYLQMAKEKVFPLILEYTGDLKPVKFEELDISWDYIFGLHCFTSKFYHNFSRDVIKGKFRNLDLNIAEIELTSGQRYYNTVFNGLFCAIPIEKNINGYMVIKKQGFSFDSLRNTDKKIDFPYKEFEKCYDVYSTDKKFTLDIMTQDFANRLMFLAKQGLNKNLIISIENDNSNKTYINMSFFSFRDLFEVSIFKSAKNPKTYLPVLKDILNLLYVIEVLDIKNFKNPQEEINNENN